MTDENEVPVVVAPEAEEEAYRMGFDRFDAITVDSDEIDDYWFDHYTETAEWANNKLPTLRAMAGAADSGHGTYTEHRDIVVVDYPYDRPMSGEKWDSHGMFSNLVDRFRDGAHDKIESNEYGENL